ncbi:hypothetical protein Tco_0726704 [Tanacetum coccineum]|uniref:Uncharacterized protein n=1 Tax=Tanacetum coccineum TaxID=301880 RepID=A0ABQ4YI01_9ASTR
MPEAGMKDKSDDSFDDIGSTSFSGASHPPEPDDTDLMMSPVCVPMGQKNSPDAQSLVKSLSTKGPFVEDLSLRGSKFSPPEILMEEASD